MRSFKYEVLGPAIIGVVLALAVYGAYQVVSTSVLEAQTTVRTVSDTVNSNGDAATINIIHGATTATVDITGTFVETLTFNVVGTDADPVACTPVGGGAAVTTATAVGKFVCPVTGWASFNVTGSGFSSGAAVVRIGLGGDQ